ncbi:unnamed protein product, partial [Allacma fusca]
CLWPPYAIKSEKFKKAVKNVEIPTDLSATTWARHKVEILKVFENYDAAR